MSERLHEGQEQKLLYTIGIYETDTIVSDYTSENGSVRRFLVAPEDLMSFFHTEKPVMTFYPEEGLIMMRTDGKSEDMFYTYPKTSMATTILVKRKKTIVPHKVYLPSLLVKARIERHSGRKVVRNMDVWCYQGTALNEDATLYELPLPNTSGSSVCLGNVDKVVEGKVRDAVWSILVDTVFNNHHDLVTKDRIPFEEYFRRSKGRVRISDLRKLCRATDILSKNGREGMQLI